MIRLARGPLPLVLLALGLLACLGRAGSGAAQQDPEALAFFRRAQIFYGTLEEVAVDALLTYENRELHAFFSSQAAFADYYSGLANQVRDAALRDRRAQLEILEFRLVSPDLAQVDLRISGRHERVLRFWRIELPRTDTWRRVDGVWMVAPAKL